VREGREGREKEEKGRSQKKGVRQVRQKEGEKKGKGKRKGEKRKLIQGTRGRGRQNEGLHKESDKGSHVVQGSIGSKACEEYCRSLDIAMIS